MVFTIFISLHEYNDTITHYCDVCILQANMNILKTELKGNLADSTLWNTGETDDVTWFVTSCYPHSLTFGDSG